MSAKQSATPIIRPFGQCESYAQDEPGKATFRWAVKRDEVPGLEIGLVRLEGPIHKTAAAHTEWEQVYLICSGSGVVHLGDRSERIEGPTVVTIPKGTRHSVELAAGETMEYAFVNQHHCL